MRRIALGKVDPQDGKRALAKELRVAIVNGALIGLGTALVAYIWKRDMRITVAICLAMLLNFLMAAVVGGLIPLGLKSLKIDSLPGRREKNNLFSPW